MALLVMGLFGLLILYTGKLTEVIRNNIEFQVYLDKTVTETDLIKINKTLSEMEFVRTVDGDPQITFISKEDAANQFIEDTGEDFTEFLGDNPLHDAYVIKIDPGFQSNDQLEELKSTIEAETGVFEVVYVRNLIDTINDNLTKLSLILLSIAVLLIIIVILLINNTIKLALFSQRFLIRSMQLVGAKSWFIQKPFLLRSAINGLIAAILASGILYFLIEFANSRIEDLILLRDNQRMLVLFAGLIVLGILIGVASTRFAIKKYLKMSLDDLY
jgi:cell division transport system permease protein